MARYRTYIDKVAVMRVVGLGYSKAAAKRAAQAAQRRARLNVLHDGLVNTGGLADSFRIRDVTVDPLKPTFKVYSTKSYARFPEFGTAGAVARPGHVLRFKPKGSQVYIFRKRVSGVRAYRFMYRARRSITKADFLPPR